MKHFIYKTTHKNGKYYIGRHSTENLNDGYIGSGKWIKSIKDKSSVTREILEYTDDIYSLIELEGKYLIEHHGKTGCMNMNINPVGFSIGDQNPMRNPEISSKISGDNHWLRISPKRTEEIRCRQLTSSKNGTHNWLGDKNPNKDGLLSKRTILNVKNIFQTNNPSIWRSKAGIHHWQDRKSPNSEGKLNKKLVEEGRHNFLGPALNNKRIADGTHNFVGSDSNLRMLAEGKHPSQQKKTCEYCGKIMSVGMYKRWHGDNCKNNSGII